MSLYEIPRWVAESLLVFCAFVLGRVVRSFTRPRCPELREVKVPTGWTNGRQREYGLVVSRCELKDLHDGPCIITEDVDHPVYWNPEDEPRGT